MDFAYVYFTLTADGNIVFEKTTYDENDVNFTDEELSKIKGCIVTHNHSYDEDSENSGVKSTSSFSSDDLIIAYQRDFKEVRMVINDETYSFRWNQPDRRKSNLFFMQMEELEQKAMKRINAAEDKAESALKSYEINPSMHSYFEKEKLAVTRTSPELRGRIEKYLRDREERGNPIKVAKP
ncbi:MAG: hypothetical protein FWF94_07700 [Oscillospiraceae bacterium]|nr:hypothetical protein [Oscillospiraceae bacterium]